MNPTLRLAELEIIRTLRRREFFVTAGVVALLFVLPFAVMVPGGFFLWRVTSILTWKDTLETLGQPLRNRLALAEAALLFGSAWYLSWSSLARERSDGELPLLEQTRLGVPSILLGKGVGLVALLMIVHGAWNVGLMLFAPWVNETAAEALLRIGGVWLWAVGYVPEGFAAALADRGTRRAYIAVRVTTAIRLIAIAPILWLMLRPEAREVGIRVWDLPVFWMENRVGDLLSPVERLFVRPAAVYPVLFLWQGATAFALVVWLARRKAR